MNKKIIDALNWRYASKSFDHTKKIQEQDWDTIEESIRLTASSYGLQPWKFIVVTNDKMKVDLEAMSYNQKQVSTCSHFILMTAMKSMDETYIDSYINDIAETRDIEVESLEGYKKVMMSTIGSMPDEKAEVWAKNQCYIAMGQALSTAALIGVDACPMEGIVKPEFDKYFELEDTNYTSCMAIAFGYRSPEDKTQFAKKVRFTSEEMFTYRG